MKKILLVDDDVLQQQALNEVIGTAGYVFMQSFDVQDAISKLSTESFDMIILDWHLTDGTSEQILEYLNQNNISTRVSILSSDDRIETVNTAMSSGAIDFLSKADTNPKEILNHIIESIGK